MPLRHADRLFDIIRILRAASQPVTAAAIAAEPEVTVHTGMSRHCRRVASRSRARRRVWARRGYELPPLMLTEDEAEAIAVGVRLLARTGDPGLQKVADVNDPLLDPRCAQDADHLSGCRRARHGAGNPAHCRR